MFALLALFEADGSVESIDTPVKVVGTVSTNWDLESYIWTRDYSANVAIIVDSVQVLSPGNVLDVSREIRMAFAIHGTAS